MARIASIVLSALLALCASAALAQTEPPSDALVDRFMAALPQPNRGARSPSAEEISRLEALNPGKSAAIRPILEEYEACAAAESRARAVALVRKAARTLGEARLSRLTEFYEGQDFALFEAFATRLSRSEELPAAEKAEFDRILAAYPLNDFRDAMMSAALGDSITSAALGDAANAGAAEKLAKCGLARKQAFDRSKLRFE